MITSIKRHASSIFNLFQGQSVYMIVVVTGMSALLAVISLYLFVFAGRSMLPTPLSGEAPVTPHVTSVPVTTVASTQPAAPPPVSPALEQPVMETIAASGGAAAVASAVNSPENNSSRSDDGDNKRAEAPRVAHQSEDHKEDNKKKD